jgi:NTE family protein
MGHPESHSTRIESATRQVPPKIGLALGSGGARGYAHLGVLEVLASEGIKISAIAGCSMGAIIGAFLASGWTVDRIRSLPLTWELLKLVRPSLSVKGLFSAQGMEHFITSELGRGATLENRSIRLAVTTLDLKLQKRLTLRKGSVAKAVSASVSVPPIFRPVVWEFPRLHCELYDAWYKDSVPADVPLKMGADMVIAVSADVAEENTALMSGTTSLEVLLSHSVCWRKRKTRRNLAPIIVASLSSPIFGGSAQTHSGTSPES